MQFPYGFSLCIHTRNAPQFKLSHPSHPGPPDSPSNTLPCPSLYAQPRLLLPTGGLPVSPKVRVPRISCNALTQVRCGLGGEECWKGEILGSHFSFRMRIKLAPGVLEYVGGSVETRTLGMTSDGSSSSYAHCVSLFPAYPPNHVGHTSRRELRLKEKRVWYGGGALNRRTAATFFFLCMTLEQSM